MARVERVQKSSVYQIQKLLGALAWKTVGRMLRSSYASVTCSPNQGRLFVPRFLLMFTVHSCFRLCSYGGKKTCCVGNPADRSNSKAVVLILFSMENHTCPELRKGAGYPKTCPKSRLFEGQASAASEAFCRCHFSFPILDFCAHAATLKTNYQAASHYALDSLHEPWPRHESCKMKVPR